MIITTNSNKETKQLAKKLIDRYLPDLKGSCLIFALRGELGSGKTRFVKGLGKALEIKQIIRSPTFTLVHEHPFSLKNKIKGTLFHIDAWRLDNPQELVDLRLDKMIKPGNVLAIEWVDKTKTALEKIIKNKEVKIINLKFKHLDPNSREIEIS